MSESQPRNILEDLAVEAVAGIDGRYRTVIDEGWRVLYAFGGMTKALALSTATRHLDRGDLAVISAQATYSAPISAGPVALQVEVLRSGRRGAQVRCLMWGSADGADPARADLSVEIVFGALDASGSALQRPRFPQDAGTPETAVPREELMGNRFVDIPFHTQTDWRLSVGAFVPDAAPTDPRAVSWMRMRQSPMTAEGAWDPAVLAVPGDMLGPAVVAGLGGSAALFVVTLQLSMQWFAPLRTEWVLQDSMVVRGGNGFVTGIVELWSQDEQLVGFGTQTALMRPFERVVAEGLSGTESQG